MSGFMQILIYFNQVEPRDCQNWDWEVLLFFSGTVG